MLESKTTEELVLPNWIDESKVSFESTMQVLDGEWDTENDPEWNNIDNEMTAEEKLARARQLVSTMEKAIADVMDWVEWIIGSGSIQIPWEDSDSSPAWNNIDNEMTAEEKLARVRQLMSTMKGTMENVMNWVEWIIGFWSIQIPWEDSDSSSEWNNIDNEMTTEEKLAGVRQLMSTMKETIENVMNWVEWVIGSGSIQIPWEE